MRSESSSSSSSGIRGGIRWGTRGGIRDGARPAWVRCLPAAVLAAVLGLATAPAGADTVEVEGELATAEDLNPDYRGRPSPVNLIVFQLTSADAFGNADFFSLYDAESGVLGGDLIARNQMLLQPGEARPFAMEVDEEARFIGVIAAFRDIENAQWRALVELPDKGFFKSFFSRDKFMIELQALALAVTVE